MVATIESSKQLNSESLPPFLFELRRCDVKKPSKEDTESLAKNIIHERWTLFKPYLVGFRLSDIE